MISKWQGYNFPDKLELNNPRRIAEALLLALSERMFVAGQPLNPLTLTVTPLGGINRNNFCLNFDFRFFNIIGSFHNFTINGGDFSGLRYNESAWTIDTMMAHLGEELLDPFKQKLLPKFYLPWARQRYRMINLLRWSRTALPNFEPDGYASGPYPDYPIKTVAWSDYPNVKRNTITHNSIAIDFDNLGNRVDYFYKYCVFYGQNEVMKKYRFDADIYYVLSWRDGSAAGTRWDQEVSRLVLVNSFTDIRLDERLLWDPGIIYYPDELLGGNISSLGANGPAGCFKFDGEDGFEFLDKEEENKEE